MKLLVIHSTPFHPQYTLYTIQMILLYRDPKGETIGSTKQAPSVMANPMSQIQPNNSELEEKVAALEKAIGEKDAEIAWLMKRNESEKVAPQLLIASKCFEIVNYFQEPTPNMTEISVCNGHDS